MRNLVLRFVGALCVVPALATAQTLIWFPVQRTVAADSDFRTEVDPPPVHQDATGPGDGEWSAALVAPNEWSWGDMWLHVGQVSSPGPYGLACQQYAVFEFQSPDAFDVSVFAESAFQSYVAVTAPTDVTFFGTLSASVDAGLAAFPPCDYEASTRIEFRRIGDFPQYEQRVAALLTLDDPDHLQSYVTEPIAWTASLPIGVYELIVQTQVGGVEPVEILEALEPGRCEAALVFSLTTAETPSPPPCGGDMDGDGDTDILDFALFQRCFDGPRP
ncbi:MAG: hypothetical protein HZB38_04830 [Planctomycetes bacterium]|nr:hypothetical protein [Planctomycetota bacterium]